MLSKNKREDKGALFGTHGRWQENFYRVDHVSALAENFCAQMPMHDLFAVTNLVAFCWLCDTECWNPDPHARPVFSTILESLQLIAQSSFVKTPNISFHVLQDDWRNEIEFMFEELRSKEQVSDVLGIWYRSVCKPHSW